MDEVFFIMDTSKNGHKWYLTLSHNWCDAIVHGTMFDTRKRAEAMIAYVKQNPANANKNLSVIRFTRQDS